MLGKSDAGILFLSLFGKDAGAVVTRGTEGCKADGWVRFCPYSGSVKYNFQMFQSVFLTPVYNLQLLTCDFCRCVRGGEVLDSPSYLRTRS